MKKRKIRGKKRDHDGQCSEVEETENVGEQKKTDVDKAIVGCAAVDIYDGKAEVTESESGGKGIGVFRHAEAEVAEEGTAEDNTGGNDGAGGLDAGAGGADGEAKVDA
ncbi:hypothetical protein MTO96_017891 [Rhipicephalus appendiculatus]